MSLTIPVGNDEIPPVPHVCVMCSEDERSRTAAASVYLEGRCLRIKPELKSMQGRGHSSEMEQDF